jgi:hypothetical protein
LCLSLFFYSSAKRRYIARRAAFKGTDARIQEAAETVSDIFSAKISTMTKLYYFSSCMPSLHTLTGAIYLTQIFGSAFLAILFLQSGIDKVVDRRGNLEWLKGHFANSPLRGLVPVLLAAIMVIEVAAGALSAIGCIVLIVSRETTIAFYGAVISAIGIIGLFFGQRMAKDYAGAAVLVPYFLLALITIYLLAQ